MLDIVARVEFDRPEQSSRAPDPGIRLPVEGRRLEFEGQRYEIDEPLSSRANQGVPFAILDRHAVNEDAHVCPTDCPQLQRQSTSRSWRRRPDRR